MMACCVSDERLKEVRTRLIEGLNAAVIGDLLDDMLHVKVLNDGEVERVKGKTGAKDRARCLIDMVRKKGASASEELLYKLAERDPALYDTL
ncbi:caspase recruitment domain-containing protein 16-like [Polyodon spathula]|uniref:caspase recruitment domain-containing protein 16-like n=1 Tax=Polyodon spathula TaxID=7913 RepID=UPI001B7DD5AF|nr:caspase recruitment domain-containing protein 16-like [Polyodon spathula]